MQGEKNPRMVLIDLDMLQEVLQGKRTVESLLLHDGKCLTDVAAVATGSMDCSSEAVPTMEQSFDPYALAPGYVKSSADVACRIHDARIESGDSVEILAAMPAAMPTQKATVSYRGILCQYDGAIMPVTADAPMANTGTPSLDSIVESHDEHENLRVLTSEEYQAMKDAPEEAEKPEDGSRTIRFREFL